ncbi:MAG TPA: histidine--tRNA ligase [Candidatus Saccharimonadales bacterium]|nr:histidine--tRNA ligase [Candidatus Saccharimonadales bacterium]
MAKNKFQNVRGMPDILPPDQPRYEQVMGLFEVLASDAGYERIDTPIIEDSGLFERSVGQETDIVSKEMYTFSDKSDNQLTLRPEPTAGVVRAYIQHGMASLAKPVKLFVAGPMFRYDRPQAGRQRQFTQVGVEVFGESNPSIDAQVIILSHRFITQLGLRDVSVQINSIGDEVCRPKYKTALVEYLEGQKSQLCEDCRQRLKTNPLRVLDCKEPGCVKVVAGAPQILDFLCKPCRAHFTGVLEYLDEFEVTYELNHLLVRGLDYYTRTVFELYGTREGAQSALGGGGRYDKLVEELGGQPTPAVGFGLGVERIIIELDQNNVPVIKSTGRKVFVASLGEPARLAGFKLIEELLDARVGAVGVIDKDGIASQLTRADKLGVPFAIIIGQKEVFDKVVILRDMTSGAQEMIPRNKIVGELRKRFDQK